MNRVSKGLRPCETTSEYEKACAETGIVRYWVSSIR